MIKNLLSLLVVFTFSLACLAQNFTLNYSTTTFTSGDVNQQLDAYVTVTNTSNTNINMLVLRKTDNLANGHLSNFCWSINCYSPMTSLSSDTVVITPGSTETSFKGTLSPFGEFGTSQVEYCFFDYNTPGDSTCVTFTYVLDPALSAGQPLALEEIFSMPFPNPSSQFVMFNYDLKSGNRGVVQIHNVLGSLIKEVKLNDKKSNILIPVTDLKAGVYFASIVVDGKKMVTRRLMVSRK